MTFSCLDQAIRWRMHSLLASVENPKKGHVGNYGGQARCR